MAELVHCQAMVMASSSPSSSSLPSLFPKGRSRSRLPLPAVSCDMHRNFTSELAPLSMSRSSAQQAHTQLHQDAPSTILNEERNWWEMDWGATVVNVHSRKELSDIVENANGKLVIVEFFAPWCGACRALYPKLCKLAMEHEEVVFVKVNFDKSKVLCQSLDIKVLPYFHLYRGDLEQLDSFSCTIAKLQKLKHAIAKYGDSEHCQGCLN